MKTVAKTLEELVELLAMEGIEAGARLPPERDLAVRLGSSRPTLRKILDQYERIGVLERRGRGGTILREKLDPSLFHAPSQQSSSPLVCMIWNSDDERKYGDSPKLRAVEEWLLDRGYLLNTYAAYQDRQDPAKERAYLKSLLRLRPVGLVALGTPLGETNAELFAELSHRGIRVAHINHFREHLPDEPFFMPDWRLAGVMAVSWLVAKNYRKALIANLSKNSPAAKRTIEGVRQGAAFHGVPLLNEPDIPYAGEDAGSAQLRRACKAIPPDTGVVVFSPLGVNVISDELVSQGKPCGMDGPLIGVGEYDPEFEPPLKAPALVFSPLADTLDALAYVTGERPSPAHCIQPQRFLP